MGLGHFDGDGADARWERHGRQPVLAGPAADAAQAHADDAEVPGLRRFMGRHTAMGAVQPDDPDGSRTFRLHLAGQRLGEAAKHRIRQHLADDVARRDGRGPDRIDAGAGLRHQIEAGERADVVGHMGRDDGLEAEYGIGVRIGAWAVDAVNRSGRGAGEINGDIAAFDGEFCLDSDRPLIAIERHRIGPLAFGQRADRLARALFRLSENVLRQRFDRCKLEFPHHGNQAAGARVVGADKGENIAVHLHGIARIGEDDRHQLFVYLTLFPHLHMRNEGSLLEGGIGFRRHADPAHVDHMAGRGEKGDELLAQEHRR